MKKFIFLIILTASFLIPNSFCFGQNRKIDSLLTQLKSDKEDTSKAKHLNALGWALMNQNPDTAIILGNQALEIITPVSSAEFISTKEPSEGKRIIFIRASILQHLGVYYYSKGEYAKAIDYAMNALKLDEEQKNKTGMAICLGNIGNIYFSKGDYPKALDYYFKALNIAEELGYKRGISTHLSNIGLVYFDQGNYPQAIDYYFKSLKIEEELGNKDGIAGSLINIGLVYFDQGDDSKALNYYFKGLKIAEEIGEMQIQTTALGNIGMIYSKNNYSQALEYYFKALKIAQKLEDKEVIARHLGNIGVSYNDQKDYPQAISYFFKSLKMTEDLGDNREIAFWFGNIGEVYTTIGKFKEAEQYLKRATTLDDSIGAINDLQGWEEGFSVLYDSMGLYKEALIHYKKSIALKDTIFSQKNKKQLIRKEMNYEFDKKEAATKAEHDKEMAVAEAEKKKQKIIIWSVIAGLLLVIVFAGFVFRSLRITRKQKYIIELQKNEVDKQKEIVEKQKEKIVDSITYAQRIQQSILMEESEVQNYLPECFIYFQPKDIVSGDFYWCSKLGDKIIIAAVDCTGHGVPGAFMSMIGNTLLNQIVNEKQITKPSEILHYLNLGVYEALHQKKDGALSDDGMDTAVCCIDYKNNELQYAGQNSLYVLSDGKLEVIKGDIYGIGGGGMIAKLHDPLKKVFANHVIPMKKGMSIYLSTDGYMDQFGGAERKKFGAHRFKDLLLNNQHLNMQKQKELFSSAHDEWKGKTVQIDDVLVIGIEL